MRLRTIMTIVFCLSALTPMLLFWFWPNSRILQNELQNVRDHQLVVARALTSDLGRYYRERISAFSVLAEKLIDSGDYSPERYLIQNLAYHSICVVNFDSGEVLKEVSGSTMSACPAQMPEAKMNWFSEQLGDRKGKVFLTEAMDIGNNRKAFYTLLQKNGILVVGALSTRYVSEMGDRVRFGEIGHAIIVDGVGKVLAHPNSKLQSELKDMTDNPAVAEAIVGKSGMTNYNSEFFMAEMFSSYTFVQGPGWGVIISQPMSEIEAKVEGIKYSTLSAMGIGLFVAIILALVATKLLTFPLIQIIRAMEGIGNGELRAHEKIKEGRFLPLEFKQARDSIMAMSNKLQENIDTISKHAYLDGVTGLPNRECFKVLAQDEIERLGLAGQKGALLFLDLDGFKQVNDVYGHRSGDDLLLGFANKVHAYCGNEMKRRASGVDNSINILPARLGGDEFVIFLGNVRSEEVVNEFASGLFQSVFGEFKLHNGVTLDVGGSVGGAIFPDHASDFDEMLRLADIAMYRAKKDGKGQFCMHLDADDFATNEASLAYEVD